MGEHASGKFQPRKDQLAKIAPVIIEDGYRIAWLPKGRAVCRTGSPVTEQKEADKATKQLERAEKVAHMKEVKHQVKENAQKQAENMDAYVMLSFDTYEAKAAFCERFGYDPDMKFIKGEVFDEQIERID